MTQPECSVIVPVHATRSITRGCLDVFAQQHAVGYEMIVVDGSGDSTPELLAEYEQMTVV